jgi:predicted AlkP superfamily phosphohydrolase/phosphomutase
MTRTLLLGLDGATFTLLDSLMDQGVMPFLGQMVRNGVRANLRSTVCPVTPPAWTTIATGRSPGHHGIYDFIVVDDSVTDRVSFRLASGQDVLCEPVWSIAQRQGLATAAMNFPATNFSGYGFGILMPGFVTSRVLKMSVRPREFWDEVKKLPGFNVEDVSWDLDEGRIPLGNSLELAPFQEWIEYLKRKETGWYLAARQALEKHACDLLCTVFEGVDRLQHQAWAILDPATRPANPSAYEQSILDASLDYYRHLDGLLRQLVESAGEDARTFIVSDHGFGPTREVFYANVWLAQNGYLFWKTQAELDQDGNLTAQNMREHFDTIDWTRTVAYARTTSANGIYIRVAKAPGQPGIPPADYLRVREEIRQGLLSYIDPATGSPVVTGAVDRDTAFPGPAQEYAPDLTLFLRDGGFLSIMRSTEVVRPRSEIKGTHRPDGILIAAGEGIRRNTRLERQSVVDITPTLLHSLGLPIPADMEGAALLDIYTDECLQRNPVRRGPATIDAGRQVAGSADAPTAADENVVLERLKALGYME